MDPNYSIPDAAVIVQKVRPHTMVNNESLMDLADQVRAIVAYGIPGNIVECGTWRGGASFLMAEMLRQLHINDRQVWMFDSFEGIPPPEAIDGQAALEWAANKESSWYHDNLRVDVESVKKAAIDLGLMDRVQIVKGFFDDTLAVNRDRIGQIALLRIDADWHASVKCCLETLYDSVSPGGLIILDDYYTFDGCAIAVHEFLGARGLAHRIEPVKAGKPTERYHAGAMFRKGAGTWPWIEQLFPVLEAIRRIVPRGESFVLIDEDRFATERKVEDRTAVPVVEKDGKYWGVPEDDAVAISEIQKQQRAGIRYVVFGFPSFWWLDHFEGLRDYLKAHARRILQDDRVIIFEMTKDAQ